MDVDKRCLQDSKLTETEDATAYLTVLLARLHKCLLNRSIRSYAHGDLLTLGDHVTGEVEVLIAALGGNETARVLLAFQHALKALYNRLADTALSVSDISDSAKEHHGQDNPHSWSRYSFLL